MDSLIYLLLVPLIWPLIAKVVFKKELTFPEVGAVMISVMLVTTGMWYASRFGAMEDTEIWNGQITGKTRQEVSCDHSYDCNCRETCSGSGTSKSCSRSCDTCYEHRYDVEWHVSSSVGNFEINTVDRQGVVQPPRWSAVQVGQPAASSHIYKNYVKGAKDSLFNLNKTQNQSFAPLIPTYPSSVYDYHYVNHTVSVGVPVHNQRDWEMLIANMLRTLGPTKQVNFVTVFVNTPDPDYINALQAAWLGGKKNDVILVIGSSKYPTIDWVDVISWTDNQLFKVQLRDAVKAVGVIDIAQIMPIVNAEISKNFNRKHMADFEYLLSEIRPSDTWMWIIGVISAIMSIGFTIFLSQPGVSLSNMFNRRSLRYGRYR